MSIIGLFPANFLLVRLNEQKEMEGNRKGIYIITFCIEILTRIVIEKLE